MLAIGGPSLIRGDSTSDSSANRAKEARSHWAFQPIRRPAMPAVADSAWPYTPIDRFVLSRLEKEGIQATRLAERDTLLRRVYLDLIGLPPTPLERAAFLADASPQAFTRVVDDLLARPEYGERWARHWLDVARYAESNGYERDGTKPNAWRYRDYVIDSLNKDRPYDQFLTEQLAGDEIAGSNAETQTATTFLRLGTWDDEPADPLVDRYDQLDDVLGTTATAFLGLTLRCARCHNHKFEPFSQRDYYGMLAVFEPLQRPQNNREDLDRYVGTEKELKEYTAALNQPSPLQAYSQILGTAPGATLKAVGFLYKFTPVRPKEPKKAYIWYERGPTASQTHLFKRGDPRTPGEYVPPKLPVVLCSDWVPPPIATKNSSGRRLWLAQWMTSPGNTLVARVIINRVWQQHFGEGLVASANDFGEAGQAPSHPELLDWLAAEFVAQGWKLKPLHRLICLSHAYQLASAVDGAAAKRDAEGTLLSHFRQRRLDAEVIRDSVLAVSGGLNRLMSGPSIYPPLPAAVLAGQSRPGDGWGKSDDWQSARRSVYIFAKRSIAPPELELLDTPDTTSSCEQRTVSTTGPQALTFLNGDFIHQNALLMAEGILKDVGPDQDRQIRHAFAVVFCRQPTAKETKQVKAFLAQQKELIEHELATKKQGREHCDVKVLQSLCLVLLNSNEFFYLN
jgi:hypothetical protein